MKGPTGVSILAYVQADLIESASWSTFARKNFSLQSERLLRSAELRNRSTSCAAARQSMVAIFSVKARDSQDASTSTPCPAQGPYWRSAICKCRRLGRVRSLTYQLKSY